ncbi:MAG: hypothetical protein K2Z81_00440 [Cyanobacteria bacterium]|nr:hypothetical protein [Cyanobacteriota bacterium]
MPQATTSILMLTSICLLAVASVVFLIAVKNLRAQTAKEEKRDEPIVDPELERRRDVARFLFRLRVSAMDQPKTRHKIDSDVENN